MRCPECSSSRIDKAGLRYLSDGSSVQRYLCRVCGYRFSQSSVKVNVMGKVRETFDSGKNNHEVRVASLDGSNKKVYDGLSFAFGENVSSHTLSIVEKDLNNFPFNNSNRQLGALHKKAKKLDTTTENKTVAGTESYAEPDVKGAIAQFTAMQITLGLSNVTIEKNIKSLRMLQDRGANLFNPEATFKTILTAKKYVEPKRLKQLSEEPWSKGTKSAVARAYVKFCKVLKIPIPEYVDFSKFKQSSKIAWIPFEEDINTLVNACSRKISVFLQVLKESGARSGEVFKLKWQNVDLERKFINIDDPEKGSLPRQVKISDKLVAMLGTLPRQGEKVWGKSTLHQLRSNFNNQRNRAAFKLCNPRLREILFHSFRHWFGSMEYHKSKDILRVKQKLGHKSINSTMIYTHLIEFETEEYTSKIAKNIKEAQELVDVGFEYVCDYNEEGKLFRKRK
jgi:integrase